VGESEAQQVLVAREPSGHAAGVPSPQAFVRRGTSLRLRLALLAVAGIVPLLAFSLGTQFLAYQDKVATTGQQTLDLARSMSLSVEQELQQRIAVLQTLTGARSLRAGDLDVFRSQAEAVLAQQFPGTNIILLREDGQQVMNTLVPPGGTLPVRSNLASIQQVFATGRPAVSNLFRGAVGNRVVVAIDVPVKSADGRVRYALSMNPQLDVFANLIQAQHAPATWIIGVFDRQGLNISRRPALDQFLGHEASASLIGPLRSEREGIIESTSLDGVHLLTVFSHGTNFGWAVAIGVPKAELTGPALSTATGTLAMGGIMLILGLSLAAYAARGVAGPIGSLHRLAAMTDRDASLALAPTGLREVDEVARALQQAENERRKMIAERNRTGEQLRQAQKMEAIGNLTGGMAHDFNTLLGVIIGNLDLVQNQIDAGSELAELVGEALTASWRGADLTRRLLAFARRQPLRPMLIDLNELIGDTIKLLHRMLGEDIEISLNFSTELWAVTVDPAQLEASLVNLAMNARDAMPKGGRLIITTTNRHFNATYVAEHAEVTEGDFAMIEISDTGTGIAAEVMSRIFDPFFTTKEVGKGTGLGLSMVFGFLQQSGGHVSVYSEVGVGTTFRLYLPRALTDSVPAEIPKTDVVIQGTGETILVVEDNAAMRRIVLRQLREFGYRTLESDSAPAALEVLQREQVDLLFTDVVMPGGSNGVDLAILALERWPALKIILTSGFPEARILGNDEPLRSLQLLSKPYSKSELSAALRAALDK